MLDLQYPDNITCILTSDENPTLGWYFMADDEYIEGPFYTRKECVEEFLKYSEGLSV